ncbi:MAG: hypothetical protein WB630_17080 [Candidatus Acidiferrales bacterium]
MDWLIYFYDHYVTYVLGIPLVIGMFTGLAAGMLLAPITGAMDWCSRKLGGPMGSFCARYLPSLTRWRYRGFLLFVGGSIALPFSLYLLWMGSAAWILQHVTPQEFETVDPATSRHRTMREIWDERAIDIRNMRMPLRLIVGVAAAELVAAFILFVRPLKSSRTVRVDLFENKPVCIEYRTLLLSLIFLIIALSFIAVGALRAHRTPRLVIFLLFALITHPAFAWKPLLLWVVCIAGIFLTEAELNRARLRLRSVAREPPWLSPFGTAAVAGAWILVYFLTLIHWMGGFTNGSFPDQLAGQIFRALVLLVPVLFLAGTDIAELADEIGHFAAGVPERWSKHRRWPVFLVLGIVTGAGFLCVLWSVRHSSYMVTLFRAAPVAVGLGLLAAGLLLISAKIFKMGTWPATRVLFSAYVTAAVFIAGGHELSNFLQYRYGHPFTKAGRIAFKWYAFSAQGSPRQIAEPDGWEVSPGGDIFVFNPSSSGQSPERAQVYLACVTAPLKDWRLHPAQQVREAFPSLLLSDLKEVPFVSRTDEGVYAFVDYNKYPRHHAPEEWTGSFWFREERQCLWIFGGFSLDRYYFSYYQPVFQEMVRSLGPVSSSTPPKAIAISSLKSEVLAAVGYLLPFGLLIIAFNLLGPLSEQTSRGSLWRNLVMVYRSVLSSSDRGWERVTPLIVTMSFLVIVGMFSGAFSIYSFAQSRWQLPDPIWALEFSLVVCTVPIAILLARSRQATSRPRALLTLLLGLNISLPLLALGYRAYDYGSSITERGLKAQAIVLVVALSWDLLMSGKELTNPENHGFPRESRVLLYAGYIMLLCTCILYFSFQRLQGTAVPPERFFEAESIVSHGILLLGTPVILSRCLIESCAILGWPK